jgi:hypothetical protein
MPTPRASWLSSLRALRLRTAQLRTLVPFALLVGLPWTAAVGACSSAGPYGYSAAYTPLDAEDSAVDKSVEYDPIMASRIPHEWQGKDLSLFGVVLARDEGRDGFADLTLSMRRLAPRNLCETGDDDSCRVTVSDREMVRVHALVKVAASDEVGQTRLQPRSLVRIVGRLEDQPDKDDGSPVLLVSFYRHWPPDYYVTEQARSYMKR